MSILKVARLGHPVLRGGAAPVAPDWWNLAESRKLIQDMIETMREYQGVGIAAPQVHAPIRVALVEIAPNPRYPQASPIPLTVLINPKVLSRSDQIDEDWEGCLSIPEWRGRVPRFARMEIEAQDEQGQVRRILADGFFCRAIQHEIDHLDGKVFVDRMPDMSTFSHLEEYFRFHRSPGAADGAEG